MYYTHFFPAPAIRLATLAIAASLCLSAEPLTVSDWSQIRAEYERNRHAAAPAEDGLQARNFRQGWSLRFDGRGFLVSPDTGKWSWGLQARAFGWAGAPRSLPMSADIRSEGPKVAYRWDGALEEWFVNGAPGLEHGFTIHQAPPGAGADLEIELAVRGDLSARGSGLALSFLDDEGHETVTYDGLKAWDAAGKPLSAKMEASGDAVTLRVSAVGAAYPITIDPIAQQTYLKPSNTGAGDRFGASVAISGNTVVVGANGESSNGVGVNSIYQANNSAPFAGAAYVFVKQKGVWTQQAYLKASNTNSLDNFGYSVAISGDTIVVGAIYEASNGIGVNNASQANNGAPQSGAAYVFVRDNSGVWTQQAYLKASNTNSDDTFGGAVAISGDTIVVGATGEASRGVSVNSMQQNDNSVLFSGAAYVFVRNNGLWTQQAYLKASNTGLTDVFGHSVSIWGNTLVVGAPGEDSDGTGVNGPAQGDDSAALSGAAYTFERVNGNWAQTGYLKAHNTEKLDVFGESVSISGDTIVVGARLEDASGTGVNPPDDDNADDSGAAYVFVRQGGGWEQQAYLKASNTGPGDTFGAKVAISGETIVVGAPLEDSSGFGIDPPAQDNNTEFDSGAVYVFVRNGLAWSQQSYMKASNTDPGDNFGSSVALSGDAAIVGAIGESSAGAGVDTPTQTDNNAPSSGAGYLFGGLGPSTKSKLGVFIDGAWYLDRNGDFAFNPATEVTGWGFPGAIPVIADWNGDGLDELGVFHDGAWFLDLNGDGAFNPVTEVKGWGAAGWTPVPGDWNGDGKMDLGAVTPDSVWFRDLNGDMQFDPATETTGWGVPGSIPLRGDWNGDGIDDLGVYANGIWFIDLNGNGVYNSATETKGWGEAGWTPVPGDWNGDGATDLGVVAPDSTWFRDLDGDTMYAGVSETLGWGFAGAIPLVGDWNGDGIDDVAVFADGVWFLDLNGNGVFNPASEVKGWGLSGWTPTPGAWK